MNPHLTPEKFDIFTNSWHCGECEEKIGKVDEIPEEVFLGNWTHYRFREIPGLIAKDELGKTIEGVWEREPRYVLVSIRNLNVVHFCCGIETDFFSTDDDKCPCGMEVDFEKEYTKSSILYIGKENKKFLKQINWHVECLPNIFKGV